MDISEVVSGVRESLSVSRVYGQPYEKDGVTVIPAAAVRGGAGGGQGEKPLAESRTPAQGSGAGTGFGMSARPVGAYVIKNGEVKWVPVFDLSRIIAGAQIVAAFGLLTLRAIMKSRARVKRQMLKAR